MVHPVGEIFRNDFLALFAVSCSSLAVADCLFLLLLRLINPDALGIAAQGGSRASSSFVSASEVL